VQFGQQHLVQPLPHPGLVPVRGRRQQVIPDPNPNCCGRNSHGIPVCSTNKIPHSAFRSSIGLRPGCRNRRSRRGSSGSTRSHSPSGTIHGGCWPFLMGRMATPAPPSWSPRRSSSAVPRRTARSPGAATHVAVVAGEPHLLHPPPMAGSGGREVHRVGTHHHASPRTLGPTEKMPTGSIRSASWSATSAGRSSRQVVIPRIRPPGHQRTAMRHCRTSAVDSDAGQTGGEAAHRARREQPLQTAV
jgi:hypothetical protein